MIKPLFFPLISGLNRCSNKIHLGRNWLRIMILVMVVMVSYWELDEILVEQTELDGDFYIIPQTSAGTNCHCG